MMSKYKTKSETPVEVMKEPVRYANLNFSVRADNLSENLPSQVLGMLTVTPDVVIFEPGNYTIIFDLIICRFV